MCMWACSGASDLSAFSASTGRRTDVRQHMVRCLITSAETDKEPGGDTRERVLSSREGGAGQGGPAAEKRKASLTDDAQSL